jgi:hypothetical protein
MAGGVVERPVSFTRQKNFCGVVKALRQILRGHLRGHAREERAERRRDHDRTAPTQRSTGHENDTIRRRTVDRDTAGGLS